jgi:hypothetical protein
VAETDAEAVALDVCEKVGVITGEFVIVLVGVAVNVIVAVLVCVNVFVITGVFVGVLAMPLSQ